MTMHRTTATLLAASAMLLTACGSTLTTTPTPDARPASPVTVTIVSPVNGQVVHGSVVHVVVTVTGGAVTPTTSTQVSPTLGHVHLYFNNQLVYMSYTLHQDLPVHPGLEYTMYAEFVAQDHFPFSPRDVTKTIFFTVAP
jgi:hypothetical protein